MWDDADNKTINPSLDYLDKKTYITQVLPFFDGEKNDIIKKNVLITSNRQMIVLDIDTIKTGIEGIRISGFPDLMENRWSTKSMRDFLTSQEKVPSFLEIYKKIYADFESKIEFKDKRYYSLITIWVMATYFFPIFEAFPYLFVMGVKRSGKTKLLLISSCLAFNARPSVGMTTATLFRMTENNRATLLIDELEGSKLINDPEFRAMLLCGYKNGLKVPRSRKLQSGRIVIDEFTPYSPKLIVNIKGLDDVMEDRAITIIMERGTDPKKINREINLKNPLYQSLRDDLYLLSLHYSEEVEEIVKLVRKVYQKNLYSIENERENNEDNVEVKCNDNTTSTLTTQTTEPILGIYIQRTQTTLNDTKTVFTARDLELSLPILTIASLCNPEIHSEIDGLLSDIINVKREDDISESPENTLLAVLVELVNKVQYYKISDIANSMERREGGAWFNAKWIGRALKRLGIVVKKRRISTGIEVWLDPKIVKKKAEDMGVDTTDIVIEGKPKEPKDDMLKRIIKEMSIKSEFVSALDIIEEGTKQGIPGVEKMIEKMLQAGILFEPKQGYLRLL